MALLHAPRAAHAKQYQYQLRDVMPHFNFNNAAVLRLAAANKLSLVDQKIGWTHWRIRLMSLNDAG